MSKGSSRRPGTNYAENWERVFGKKHHTSKDKWDRISDPQTIEDYGLCLTETELLEFTKGRQLVESLQPVPELEAVGCRMAELIERTHAQYRAMNIG